MDVGPSLPGTAGAENQPQGAELDPQGMQELLDGKHGYRSPRRGEVLDGVVVRLDREGILVDIGSKSEGIIPSHELQNLTGEDAQVKVGDEVLVYVVQAEDQEGRVVLSLDRAKSERGWRTLQRYYEYGEIFEAQVVGYNKGGLIVNVAGVRGFVPASQVVELRGEAGEGVAESRLAQMIGRTLRLKVIEINRRRNRLILSERVAIQEWRAQQRDRLLKELQPGQIRRGRVSSLTDFGAFVDLGGADGLIHLSELSWERVKHPSDVLKVGDEVDVFVMSVDPESKKIALSLRRARPEPWSLIADKYRIGQLVTATITKLTSFGAFARVEPGVEGLIHISELDDRRIAHPKEAVREGNTLTLMVVRFEPERHRLGLSLRQAKEQLAQQGDQRSEE